MNIRFEKNNTQEHAGLYISQLIREHRGKPLLLLLSGGSSLEIVRTVESIDKILFGKRITIAMVDERFSTDRSVNNFAQLMQTQFFIDATRKGCNFFDSRVHTNDTSEALCIRFEKFLRMWEKIHPRGVIIALLGIGEDGHTAGIMPCPDDEALFKTRFENEQSWVVAYPANVSGRNLERITVTNTFLRLVHHSVVYAIGSQKEKILKRVTLLKKDVHRYPARIIHSMQDVTLFTDITF